MFPFLRHTSEPLALDTSVCESPNSRVLLYMVVPLIVLALGNGARDGTVDATASAIARLAVQLALHDGASSCSIFFTGASGVIFAVLLYRSKLAPRPLAVLGLIGYPVLLAGRPAMFGRPTCNRAQDARHAPGGLFRTDPPDLAPVGGSATGRAGVKSSDLTDRVPVAASSAATVTRGAGRRPLAAAPVPDPVQR
jgi:hypothetical protein